MNSFKRQFCWFRAGFLCELLRYTLFSVLLQISMQRQIIYAICALDSPPRKINKPPPCYLPLNPLHSLLVPSYLKSALCCTHLVRNVNVGFPDLSINIKHDKKKDLLYTKRSRAIVTSNYRNVIEYKHRYTNILIFTSNYQ